MSDTWPISRPVTAAPAPWANWAGVRKLRHGCWMTTAPSGSPATSPCYDPTLHDWYTGHEWTWYAEVAATA